MSCISLRSRIALGSLVLLSLVAASAQVVLAVDKYTSGKVGAIVVTPNGNFTFHLEGNPPLCNKTPTGDGLDWVTVTGYATSEGKKNLLTMVTSAKLSGRSVQVRGKDNTTPNEWGCRLEALDFF